MPGCYHYGSTQPGWSFEIVIKFPSYHAASGCAKILCLGNGAPLDDFLFGWACGDIKSPGYTLLIGNGSCLYLADTSSFLAAESCYNHNYPDSDYCDQSIVLKLSSCVEVLAVLHSPNDIRFEGLSSSRTALSVDSFRTLYLLFRYSSGTTTGVVCKLDGNGLSLNTFDPTGGEGFVNGVTIDSSASLYVSSSDSWDEINKFNATSGQQVAIFNISNNLAEVWEYDSEYYLNGLRLLSAAWRMTSDQNNCIHVVDGGSPGAVIGMTNRDRERLIGLDYRACTVAAFIWLMLVLAQGVDILCKVTCFLQFTFTPDTYLFCFSLICCGFNIISRYVSRLLQLSTTSSPTDHYSSVDSPFVADAHIVSRSNRDHCPRSDTILPNLPILSVQKCTQSRLITWYFLFLLLITSLSLLSHRVSSSAPDTVLQCYSVTTYGCSGGDLPTTDACDTTSAITGCSQFNWFLLGELDSLMLLPNVPWVSVMPTECWVSPWSPVQQSLTAKTALLSGFLCYGMVWTSGYTLTYWSPTWQPIAAPRTALLTSYVSSRPISVENGLPIGPWSPFGVVNAPVDGYFTCTSASIIQKQQPGGWSFSFLDSFSTCSPAYTCWSYKEDTVKKVESGCRPTSFFYSERRLRATTCGSASSTKPCQKVCCYFQTIVTLDRMTCNSRGVFSQMIIQPNPNDPNNNGDSHTFYTLEPNVASMLLEPKTYDVTYFLRPPKGKRRAYFAPHVLDATSQAASAKLNNILIHYGNQQEDSRGCILIGEKTAAMWVDIGKFPNVKSVQYETRCYPKLPRPADAFTLRLWTDIGLNAQGIPTDPDFVDAVTNSQKKLASFMGFTEFSVLRTDGTVDGHFKDSANIDIKTAFWNAESKSSLGQDLEDYMSEQSGFQAPIKLIVSQDSSCSLVSKSLLDQAILLSSVQGCPWFLDHYCSAEDPSNPNLPQVCANKAANLNLQPPASQAPSSTRRLLQMEQNLDFALIDNLNDTQWTEITDAIADMLNIDRGQLSFEFATFDGSESMDITLNVMNSPDAFVNTSANNISLMESTMLSNNLLSLLTNNQSTLELLNQTLPYFAGLITSIVPSCTWNTCNMTSTCDETATTCVPIPNFYLFDYQDCATPYANTEAVVTNTSSDAEPCWVVQSSNYEFSYQIDCTSSTIVTFANNQCSPPFASNFTNIDSYTLFEVGELNLACFGPTNLAFLSGGDESVMIQQPVYVLAQTCPPSPASSGCSSDSFLGVCLPLSIPALIGVIVAAGFLLICLICCCCFLCCCRRQKRRAVTTPATARRAAQHDAGIEMGHKPPPLPVRPSKPLPP